MVHAISECGGIRLSPLASSQIAVVAEKSGAPQIASEPVAMMEDDEASEKKAQTKKLHDSDYEATIDPYKHCELPAGMTSVPDNAFAHWDGKGKGCKAMESLGIPSSVTAIGDAAFAKCSSLTRLTIPASVTEIEEGAFARCTSLLAVTINASITTIESKTFAMCSSLHTVSIPESVTTIESCAFEGCTSLLAVTVPAGATVRYRAFEDTTTVTIA
jgi:hypothetical protein